MMNYAVGSVADLISGNVTPNKPKVVQKEVENTSVQSSEKSEVNTQVLNKSTKKRKKIKDHESVEKSSSKKSRTKPNVRNNPVEVDFTQKQKEHENSEKDQKFFDVERENKTIFVGNVPIETTKLRLKKLFGKFGPIEAVRLRCVAPDDPNISKKLAVIQKRFNPKRTSLHCFIRFQTREDAMKALEMNGFLYKKNHLRVNMSQNNEKPDDSKALFVGNIPFETEEEDLWTLFESVGEISSVRLVRDSKTSLGKGFGYVNFKSSDGVELALETGEFKLKNRILRIQRCNNATGKNKGKKEKKRLRNTNGSNDNEMNNFNEKKIKSIPIKKSVFQGLKAVDKKKKKLDKNAKKRKLISKLLTSKSKKNDNISFPNPPVNDTSTEKDPYTLKIFY